MRRQDDYILKYANNKFSEKIKSCGLGEFNITRQNNHILIHLYYEGRTLTMNCYKNPYFIAQGVFYSKRIRENFDLIQQYQDEGLVAGLDFIVTEKGIKKRFKSK